MGFVTAGAAGPVCSGYRYDCCTAASEIMDHLQTYAVQRTSAPYIPTIFVNVTEPIEQGFVESLATAWREYHGVHQHRTIVWWQMAATAQGD